MLHHSPGRRRSLSRFSIQSLAGIIILSALATSAKAQPDHPIRITFNTVEDRTTSGSIAHECGHAVAAWMQEQPGPGWNLMWSESFGNGWSNPLPIETAEHEDYAPQLMMLASGDIHAVWQRQTGAASEIIHGEKRYDTGWLVEGVTTNNTEDLSPDIATGFDGLLHLTWAGFDAASGEGKVFYARKVVSPPGPWMIEVLSQSELGPFWTGAAPKIDISAYDHVVHIVYRGNDAGLYHIYYARRNPQGLWSYQTLTSPNQEDLLADVTGRSPYYSPVTVAMSGSDCFGCPSRIYLRRSDDLGLTFESPQLVSGNRSAELGNISGGSVDVAVTASVLSGNILTGELIQSREIENFIPQTISPANSFSSFPGAYQVNCVGRGPYTFFGLGVVYTNSGGEPSPADSAEVWAILGGEPGLSVDDLLPVHGARLSVTAAPNPFDQSTTITATSVLPGRPIEVNLYDALGRLVQRFSENAPASSFVRSWDGRDLGGRPACAGIFFVETKQGTERTIQQLTLLH